MISNGEKEMERLPEQLTGFGVNLALLNASNLPLNSSNRSSISVCFSSNSLSSSWTTVRPSSLA